MAPSRSRFRPRRIHEETAIHSHQEPLQAAVCRPARPAAVGHFGTGVSSMRRCPAAGCSRHCSARVSDPAEPADRRSPGQFCHPSLRRRCVRHASCSPPTASWAENWHETPLGGCGHRHVVTRFPRRTTDILVRRAVGDRRFDGRGRPSYGKRVHSARTHGALLSRCGIIGIKEHGP